jgi:hypothetical protein
MKSLKVRARSNSHGCPRLPRPTKNGLDGTRSSRRRRTPTRNPFHPLTSNLAQGHGLLKGYS